MKTNTFRLVSALLGTFAFTSAAVAADGKGTFDKVCAGCHIAGIAGAPKVGNNGDWAPRLKRGIPALYKSALEGTAKGMPPKGGRTDLANDDVKAAVDFMISKLPAKVVDVATMASKAEAAKPAAAPVAAPAPAAPAAAAPVVALVAATTPAASANVNSFNRLMKPPSARNPPPPEDGIHDPENDGTHSLQPPRASFSSLPSSPSGNRVNWVQSLNEKKITPRWDRNDPNAEPLVMDLNIVREVKGTMPNVVYPHKQHTEWLDCSNCHPAIFEPQKGANKISMAAILLGQKCGVCHGKVAFPVSECRRCHSQKKEPPATTAGR